ncbi:hypothetical protein EZI54_07350 [Marinobacter halodurans]|uniref:Uncharacterized protein n=1 Tax=Marinobacter halodurans TaxID=2528979 RepID=A0ABY1ZMJ7_9GAMM|nr:hypothetical protein [Marinobacter halodurans]TBW57467.1 hypothetical protein EZI54_07350 [Marinobacter halodurans]
MTYYKISSGMGGIFIVRIVKEMADNRVQVVIDMGNPAFDGSSRVVHRDQLTPYRPSKSQ